MSRTANRSKTRISALLFAAAIASISTLSMAHAQYVGRVDTNQDSNKPTLRATAVLEYTGDLAKPNASRLIPLAVWDGERYQPGGLYLAQPVPLTVESGTQYELQVAGIPKGLFDVKGAADMGGSWVGVGGYRKPEAPNYAKLRRSKNLPRIMVEDNKPHFAHVPVGDANPGSNSGATTQAKSQPDAPVDPDRPTLHSRANTGSTTQNTSSDANTAPAANGDPDRPTLHHHSTTSSSNNGERETATDTVDPNRPHLEHGRPAETESLDAPATVVAKLAGAQPDIEQMAAVSDAANRPQHSYVYSWSDPEDEKKMQAALEKTAQELLAKSAPAAEGKPSVSANANATTSAAASTTRSTTRRRASRLRKTPTQTLPTLTDEQLKAFELSYGGGATLVYSATTGQGADARYITLIAQPDFNGIPRVLFKQITTERDLNVIPRMKLVDAMDTDADNRAELIFALENEAGRQYAIYRVANNAVEQVFTTGS